MKNILFLIFIISFSSCDDSTPKHFNLQEAEREQEIKDSLKKNLDSSLAATVMDTTGIYLAPIKILNANIVESESGTFRNVWLQWKNVSAKKISSIRFNWYGINAFNEPSDLGGIINGFGGGFDDNEINPGETSDGTWNSLSRDAKKIIRAWPIEVAFGDGTIWKFKKLQ